MVKLERTLYIGLGGAGCATILNTKAAFVETYGKVPSAVSFLGIDTAGDTFSRYLIRQDRCITFEPEEKVFLRCQDSRAYYMAHSNDFPWLSERNVSMLAGVSNCGAGCMRSNGKIAFIINYQSVERAIRHSIDRIYSALDVEQRWNISDGKVRIIVVSSLAGGTGSGILIDLGYLIRGLYGDNVQTDVYAILSGAYSGLHPGLCIHNADSYATILDIDYLFSYIKFEQPYKYKLIGGNDFTSYYRPFDRLFVLDNQNGNGYILNSADQIYYTLGTALVNRQDYKGPLFSKLLFEGSLDIEDKKSILQGLGLCRMELSEDRAIQRICSICAKNVVAKLLKAQESIEDESREFIRILGAKIKNVVLPAVDPISLNLRRLRDLNTPINKWKQQAIQMAVPDSQITLDTLLLDHLFSEGLSIIDVENLLSRSEEYILERVSSLENQRNDYVGRLKIVDHDIEEQIQHVSRIVLFRTTREILDLMDTLDVWSKCITDIKKVEIEIAYWDSVLNSIHDFVPYLKNVESNLTRIYGEIRIDSVNCENPLVIDLSNCSESVIDIPAIMEPIMAELTFDSIVQISSVEQLIEYVLGRLPEYVKNISLVSFEKFIETHKAGIIDRIIQAISPLIHVDMRGFRNYSDVTQREGLLCVSSGANTIEALERTGLMKDLEERLGFILYIVDNGRSDVSFISETYPMPAFCVSNIMGCEQDYNHLMERQSMSFDYTIEQEMERIHHSLLPEICRPIEERDTVELWVKGIILGLIIRKDHCYYMIKRVGVKQEELDENWYKLNKEDEGNSRCAAFSMFKRMIIGSFDFLKKIDKKERRVGSAEELYRSAALMSIEEYIKNYCSEDYSNVLQSDDLEIKNQLEMEFDYVHNRL